jgi:hypothetical protein
MLATHIYPYDPTYMHVVMIFAMTFYILRTYGLCNL